MGNTSSLVENKQEHAAWHLRSPLPDGISIGSSISSSLASSGCASSVATGASSDVVVASAGSAVVVSAADASPSGATSSDFSAIGSCFVSSVDEAGTS